MDWLDKLAALFGVLLPIITAIVTIYSTKNQVRNQNKSTDVEAKRVESSIDIDNAQKINALSISLVDEIRKQLDDCSAKKNMLEKEYEIYKVLKVDIAIKYKRLSQRLTDVLDQHERMAEEYGTLDCKGYEILNSMIRAVIDEINKEVDL